MSPKIDDLKRQAVVDAMEKYGANQKAQAAESLGISRKTLYDLLHRYGLADKYIRDGEKA